MFGLSSKDDRIESNASPAGEQQAQTRRGQERAAVEAADNGAGHRHERAGPRGAE